MHIYINNIKLTCYNTIYSYFIAQQNYMM